MVGRPHSSPSSMAAWLLVEMVALALTPGAERVAADTLPTGE